MRKGPLLVALQFLLLAALVLSPESNSVGVSQIALAVVVFSIGLIGLLRAARDLGSALTPLPESKAGAPFVTTGLYKYIRHPIYLFLLFLSAGIVLYKNSPEALIVLLALVALLNIKYRYEDKLLAAKWPEAGKYQAIVPALIPKIKKGN